MYRTTNTVQTVYIYPTSWKIQPIRGQDCCCMFCGMQLVIFHSTFRHYLHATASCAWDPLEDFSNHLWNFQLLRTFLNSSDHVRKFPDDLWTLPKTSEDLPKILKNRKNSWKTVLNCFWNFPWFPNTSKDFQRFSKNFKKYKNSWKTLLNCFQRFLKISENFYKIIKTPEKQFWTIFKDFRVLQKFSNNFSKTILNRFWNFQKITEDSEDFPKVFKNGVEAFPKFAEILENSVPFRKLS